MNSIPSLLPKHADNRKVPGIGSTIENISENIGDCLSEYSRTSLKEKNETFAKLLGQLQDEIERKREKINYDYSFEDYKERLCQSDEVLQRVFEEKVLGEEKIKALYEALLGSIENKTAKEVLKQKLWEECFEDLVCESMEEGNYEIAERSINLTGKNFVKNNNDELNDYFANLGNVTHIDLIDTYLHELNEEQLQIILENLRNVNSIDLTGNNLGKCNQQQLQAIFENLRNVKCIDVGINNLHELDKEGLCIIFENLGNVKSVNLSWNHLDELDEEGLCIIFENLRNVKSIILWGNILSKFSENQLQIIFENLAKAEKIYIAEYPEFVEKIVSMFPYLKDKIINQR